MIESLIKKTTIEERHFLYFTSLTGYITYGWLPFISYLFIMSELSAPDSAAFGFLVIHWLSYNYWVKNQLYKTLVNKMPISKNEKKEILKEHEELERLSKNKKINQSLIGDTYLKEIPSIANDAGNIISNISINNKIIITCSIATALGFFTLPYGYYTLLKLLFLGSLIYFALEYKKSNEFTGSTLAVLSILIILYNPIFPVALGSKSLWILVNLSTIGYLYWLAGVINLDNKNFR